MIVRLKGWWRTFIGWWTARGVIPRWQLLLVYGLVVAAGAVGLSKTSDAASKAKDAAFDAKTAIAQIQDNRLEQCLQANERHDGTLAVLDAALDRLHGQARVEAEANRKQTVAFIEALAPHRDCRQTLAIHHK